MKALDQQKCGSGAFVFYRVQRPGLVSDPVGAAELLDLGRSCLHQAGLDRTQDDASPLTGEKNLPASAGILPSTC